MTGKKGTVVWPMEVAQIWREHYDRKKNIQSSGRLCFSAGSNYNRKNYDQKKKGTVESSDRPFFSGGFKLQPEKITTRKIKSTVVWPMEAAQIWRECYNQKKNIQSCGRLCFSVGSNYNRKKLRPEKKGTVVWPSVGNWK
jgi:hypothetical protein